MKCWPGWRQFLNEGKRDETIRGFFLHRNEMLAVAERHHARNVRVFGFVVRGEDTDRSDLDLLAEFEKSPTLFDLSGFQSDLEVPVELLLEADTRRLKEHIREEILIV